MKAKKARERRASGNGAGPIFYGRGRTAIGPVLVAFTARGICAVRLDLGTSPVKTLADLRRQFPHGEFAEDRPASRSYLEQIDRVLAGRLDATRVALDLRGTPFQKKVWQAMMRIPHGSTCSYQDLARKAGKPRAVRAVASACARNPIALVVPCHRVLRTDGSLGGYFYGLKKKQEILRFESERKKP